MASGTDRLSPQCVAVPVNVDSEAVAGLVSEAPVPPTPLLWADTTPVGCETRT